MTVEQHLARAAQAQQQGRRADVISEAEAALRLSAITRSLTTCSAWKRLARNDTATALRHFRAATRPIRRRCRAVAEPRQGRAVSPATMRPNDAALKSALESDQRHLMARSASRNCMSGAASWAMRRRAGPASLRLPPSIPAPGRAKRRSSIMRAPSSRPAISNCPTRWRTELAGGLGGRFNTRPRRIGAAIDVMLGRRQVYTNQCFGLHYPFLPADEFFDREHFPWLAQLEAHTDVIRAEVVALLASDDPGLSPYVTMPPGTPRNVWTELNQFGGVERASPVAGRRADRGGLRARAEDGEAGREASARECPGPRADGLLLDSPGRQAHPAAHRRDQHARDHPPAADRSRPAAPSGSAAKRANGAKARRSRSTTRSSMKPGTAATRTARC